MYIVLHPLLTHKTTNPDKTKSQKKLSHQNNHDETSKNTKSQHIRNQPLQLAHPTPQLIPRIRQHHNLKLAILWRHGTRIVLPNTLRVPSQLVMSNAGAVLVGNVVELRGCGGASGGVATGRGDVVGEVVAACGVG